MSTTTQPWEQPRRDSFLHFLVDRQTYLNLVYLLLAFPLGTAYFVFLVTGFSLGIGMAITLLGIPILIGMLAATWALAGFERYLTNTLLDARIPPVPFPLAAGEGLWPRVKRLVSSPATWKSLAYLVATFPLGILSFTLSVTLLATSLSLAFLPLYYQWTDFYYFPYHRVTELSQALFFVPLGVILFPLSLAALNGFAALYRTIARALLGE